MNEDGFADVIAASGEPASYLYLGSATGLAATAATKLPGSASDIFGNPVAPAGDVNGDGFADVLVGSDEKAVYVYHGSATGLSTVAATKLPLGFSLTPFNNALASAGDVNGDGYGDVVVGDLSSDTVKVFLGSATGLSTTAAATLSGPLKESFGSSVASAGDVNGDQFGDVIVGTYEEHAYVYLGGPTGLATTPSATLSAPFGSYLGLRVNGAGDVNGDGYADVMFNGNAVDPKGSVAYAHRVYVFLGGSGGVATTPATTLSIGKDTEKTHFGIAKTAADYNGDGYWDIAVGAEWIDTVYVYMGGPSGTSSTSSASLSDSSVHGNFGCNLSGADTNGDGFAELGVGAWNAGSLYVFPGSAAGVVTTPGSTFTSAKGPPITVFGVSFGFAASGS